MKSYYKLISSSLLLLLVFACSNEQATKKYSSLTPLEFDAKIKETGSTTIIDVRTPEEFANGHLEHAKNIDWNGINFQNQIAKVDKSKPVFIYCLSGGRSSNAAEKMLSMGFSNVYELSGGILKWRSADLPETTVTTNGSGGMDQKQFQTLITSDKLVLVDFYASWCAPCKEMKPDLDALEIEMKDKLILLRIDADENPLLAKELNIEVLPTLLLYKNKNLIWSNTGYLSKEEIAKQLK